MEAGPEPGALESSARGRFRGSFPAVGRALGFAIFSLFCATSSAELPLGTLAFCFSSSRRMKGKSCGTVDSRFKTRGTPLSPTVVNIRRFRGVALNGAGASVLGTGAMEELRDEMLSRNG